MKKLILTGFVMVFIASCNQPVKRYTQQSPEIDSYRKSLEAYEKLDWEGLATFYADTAIIINNVPESEGLSLDEILQIHKEDAAIFSSWRFIDEDSDFEMVVTDDGETWVNFWGTWEGTLKANNKNYVIPAHSTTRFIDGKIVKELGYWDVSKIVMDIRAIEEAEALALKEPGGAGNNASTTLSKNFRIILPAVFKPPQCTT